MSEFTFRKPSGKYRTDCKPCRSTSCAAQRYGVSVGSIEALAEKQGNRCAICDTHKDDTPHASFKYNPLVIDHDHTTGAVRGLLCPTCNSMLGHAKDSVALLAGAIAYLSSSNPSPMGECSHWAPSVPTSPFFSVHSGRDGLFFKLPRIPL